MSFFEKDELKLLWPFYLENLISTLIFIYPPFWIVYFKDISLSLAQIGLLFSSISISTLMFEIPTGAIADIFGRKFSMLIGHFSVGIIFIMMYFTKSFYLLLALFFLWGLFGTFMTGSYESWVTDYLKFHKKPKMLENFFIKEHSFERFSLMIAGLLGTLLVSLFGLGIIWPVTGVSHLISALIFLFIPEKGKPEPQKTYGFTAVFKQAYNSVKFSLGHHTLFYIILATMFVSLWACFGCPGVGDVIWQSMLKGMNFPEYAFGYVFSGIIFVGMIAPYFSKLVFKFILERKKVLSLIYVMLGIVSLSVLFVSQWATALIVVGLLAFFSDMENPIFKSYFQRFAPSKMRATITNFNWMLSSVAIAIGAPIAGLLADKFGPQAVFGWTGLIMIIPALIYYTIKERK